MKQVLGLVGSARRLGNSEILVKAIFRQLDVPAELQLLRLTDFQIDACRGCYRCLMDEGRCPIADDHAAVLAAITAADALILVAPVYFLGVHSALKRFLDRGLTLYSHVDRLWQKPAVGAVVAGIPGMEGHALLDIESFLKLILADVRHTRVVYGALPGEVFMNEANHDITRTLAASLFGDRPAQGQPRCSLCGGDTFRFLGHNRVRCMLCSNTGTLQVSPDQTRMEMQRSGHQLFLERQDVIDHKAWLIGMKERFTAMRDRLKPITLDYRRDGSWIKPEHKRANIQG